MRKRIASIMTAILLAASLAGGSGACGAPASANTPAVGRDGEPHVTLIYAEVNPRDSLAGQIAQAFKKEAEARSDGSLTIDIHYNGELGFEDEVLDSMMREDDEIQISRISTFALNELGAEDSSLLSLPYTFVDREHFWRFAYSQLAAEMLEEDSQNLPIKGLFYGEEGFRHFFTKEAIHGYRNFEDQKLRVYNDPIMVSMVEAMGAEPVQVSFGDVYASIRSGIVDGAEQPIINYRVNSFPEVAQNVFMDGHTLGILEIVITDIAWDGLTAKQQDAIHRASRVAQKANREIVEDMERQFLDELIAANLNIQKASVEDINGLKKLWAPVIQENTLAKSARLEELYLQILEMQQIP